MCNLECDVMQHGVLLASDVAHHCTMPYHRRCMWITGSGSMRSPCSLVRQWKDSAMFQSVIWDFDGTLVDTYPAIARAVNRALATFGRDASLARVIELSSICLDLCIKTLAADNDLHPDVLDAHFAL